MSPVLVVIPARYASSRYPGKPLVGIRGAGGGEKSLIRRTWEAAGAVAGADRVVVATDDERIAEAAGAFGAEVAMTSAGCANGTERCAEAAAALEAEADIVVNLQGDAALTPPAYIEASVAALRDEPAADAATPVLRCDGRALEALRAERRAGRVGGTTAVANAAEAALYFSKEIVPFSARHFGGEEATPVFHHVGVYAYRRAALAAYPGWETGPLERHEGLEQLRFLEQGRRVRCVEVAPTTHGFWELNNPEDLPRIEAILAAKGVA